MDQGITCPQCKAEGQQSTVYLCGGPEVIDQRARYQTWYYLCSRDHTWVNDDGRVMEA